jgi:trehalose 6-phosphate phosphatase
MSGVAVEHKRFGVAVHYRNAERNRVGEVLSAVREAGQRTGLRITTGREVIELRPDVDWDKGKTLRWVLEEISDDESAALLPMYLGDDITDEDAFDAIQDDGVGIVVRHNDDGDRATAARYALDSPARVSEFTGRLAQQLAVNAK